jgi:D-psicose/D-tagatose/L-ribulose 3-epimerase
MNKVRQNIPTMAFKKGLYDGNVKGNDYSTYEDITNVGAGANPISPDAAIRERSLDQLKWAIEISALLGSENLVGPFFAAYGLFSGSGPTEDELNRSADIMRRASVYAREANNLTLSIEFLNRFETYLLNTVEQSVALVEKVNQANFGILYDTHHAHHEENNIRAAICAGGKSITHVHFSENQRGTWVPDWSTGRGRSARDGITFLRKAWGKS